MATIQHKQDTVAALNRSGKERRLRSKEQREGQDG